METLDVVIPVADEPDNEELRYCLRSLVNVPHRNVFTVGHRHKFLSDKVQHINVMQKRTLSRFENSARNLFLACNDERVSKSFYWFNDDFYAIRPVSDIPYYHMGDIREHVQRKYNGRSSQYIRAMLRTADFLKQKGYPTLCYEVHAPIKIHKSKFIKVYNLTRNRHVVPHGADRSLYANIQMLGGEQIDDVKVYKPNDPIPNMPFVSSGPGSWVQGDFKKHITEMYSKKCKYEV